MEYGLATSGPRVGTAPGGLCAAKLPCMLLAPLVDVGVAGLSCLSLVQPPPDAGNWEADI